MCNWLLRLTYMSTKPHTCKTARTRKKVTMPVVMTHYKQWEFKNVAS